ncbi:hypothetical protein D9V37_01875 [Nocardioides mangrovicus]|uniref:Uncharacterized protein n=1 Tax=Nocardioides mangrovicus TaxID=2478913 RepID=A0A3L8P656_9ACTN|nr:hypothetical protein [Nocardioides mangrovicus]RLV50735.1 hypothetical protein D9V37_01875 [Nocardioides mangrovicus]
MLETTRVAGERAAPVVRLPRQRQSYERWVAAAGDDTRAQRALMLPIALCGLALLVIAATLGALAVHAGQHSSRSLHLPDHAGALSRDATPTADLSSRISTAQQGFRDRFGQQLAGVVGGAYVADTAATGRPTGPVVFVGAAIDTAGDPGEFIDAFTRSARAAGYDVEEVAAGSDAAGICMSTSRGEAATCAWSTGDAVGELVPTETGWSVDQLAAAMRAMRGAAERTVTVS